MGAQAKSTLGYRLVSKLLVCWVEKVIKTLPNGVIFPFFRDLFNAAFVSCWTELTESEQDELINSLEHALTSQEIPEITQTLLNLAEFMEHCDKVGMVQKSS